MPEVSVIIPTYNRAGLIREAVCSALAQTWAGHEVVVVDDGSDDNTQDVLADLLPRIAYRRTPHAGASAARNIGLDVASGERVAFLDSDDIWDATFLEKMMAALDTAPWAGFAYCDYATLDSSGSIQAACLAADERICGNLFARLLESDFISTGTLLIRRECLTKVGGFDPRMSVAHDWDLWLRLARHYDAVYVDEPLIQIRFHAGNLSRDADAICADNLLILSKMRRALGRDARQYDLVLRRHSALFHRSMAHHLSTARRPLPALAHLFRAALVRFFGLGI